MRAYSTPGRRAGADYGLEVLAPFPYDPAVKTPEEAERVWLFLSGIRPLDRPTLWPVAPKRLETGRGVAVTLSARVFWEDWKSRGTIPRWEVTAYWWACAVVLFWEVVLAGGNPDLVAVRPAQALADHLRLWRESFRTAIVWLEVVGGYDRPADEDARRLWYGYRSDLRHAGALQAVEAWRLDNDAFPGISESCWEGLGQFCREETYPLPSGMQGRLDDGEDEPTEAPEDEPAETWWEDSELLADLTRQGFTLAAEGAGVRIAPSSRLSAGLRQAIRRHKADLLAILAARAEPRPLVQPSEPSATAPAPPAAEDDEAFICRTIERDLGLPLGFLELWDPHRCNGFCRCRRGG
jgi:hypothetical protein